jgi:Na+-transporting methylmalonyl-CoA/oxaloacetate decarboxylase gamma subunit
LELGKGIMIMVVGLSVVFILLSFLVAFMSILMRLSRVAFPWKISSNDNSRTQEEVAVAIGLALHEHFSRKEPGGLATPARRLNAWKMSGWLWQQQSRIGKYK